MSIEALKAELLSELRPVRHGFFSRLGGCSEGLYRSLNCGGGSGDDIGCVLENRRRAALHLGDQVCALNSVHQVHGPHVVEVSEPWPLGQGPKADAMVTERPGLALGVLTADCVPVLFAVANKPLIAAAHAGWRGAIGGVLEATVQAMEDRGADRANIRAAIGPCIAQASYEVGSEFQALFLDADPAYGRYFVASERAGHQQFDLPGFVRDRLFEIGVGGIENLARDSYREEGLFFSYRRSTHRQEADYGRALSAIVLS